MIVDIGIAVFLFLVGYAFASHGWPKISIGNRKEIHHHYYTEHPYDEYEDEEIDEQQRELLN